MNLFDQLVTEALKNQPHSYEKRSMLLLNPYGVDLGTSGLVIQAQSREEIYADKLLALALRPNRLKYRDLWDIVWLHQHGVKPNLLLNPDKLRARNHTLAYFFTLWDEREKKLLEDETILGEFQQEMHRFLPIEQVTKTMGQANFLACIRCLIGDLSHQMRQCL